MLLMIDFAVHGTLTVSPSSLCVYPHSAGLQICRTGTALPALGLVIAVAAKSVVAATPDCLGTGTSEPEFGAGWRRVAGIPGLQCIVSFIACNGRPLLPVFFL